MNDERLEDLSRNDDERQQQDALLRKGNDLSCFTIKPQEDRNKPKVIAFKYKSQKTTLFRYVDTTAENRLNHKKVTEKYKDDDSEDSAEPSDEEIPSDSKNDDNCESNSNRRKEKKNKAMACSKHFAMQIFVRYFNLDVIRRVTFSLFIGSVVCSLR
ncbi:hypothetical protein LOAG_03117 [Loa loa]|uniref:Uncharacterized protein n=1 Tax=Loa loa TaxID=7209 RepID=A0A1S0U5N6_LOALO|nr:hypothetical protein LOAG_03117 [Loa loa]EFO25369.2 hypothetical protein LOAG_03117 [Loa loa]